MDISVSLYVTISFGENSERAATKYRELPLTEVCSRKCVIAF